jgi:hypothetical protein
MSNKKILVLDHEPDTSLLDSLATKFNASVTCANGYLQAVAKALRIQPDTIYVRRDLPWLRRAKFPQEFWENPVFTGVRVIFYTPDELREEWPSQNAHRPLLA